MKIQSTTEVINSILRKEVPVEILNNEFLYDAYLEALSSVKESYEFMRDSIMFDKLSDILKHLSKGNSIRIQIHNVFKNEYSRITGKSNPTLEEILDAIVEMQHKRLILFRIKNINEKLYNELEKEAIEKSKFLFNTIRTLENAMITKCD